MYKAKFSTGKNFLSCENYVSIQTEEDIKFFYDMAFKLKISLLVIDNLSISHRNSILQLSEKTEYSIITPQAIYEKIRQKNYDLDQLVSGFKNELTSNNQSKIMLVSRKTITEGTIDELKKTLSLTRNEFEILCLRSTNQSLLKWAAHDRRVDYISIDLTESNKIIDNALCSLMKQNDKYFEVIMSSLLKSPNEKELSTAIRNGRKIIEKLVSNNVSFILTINPNSPFLLRTALQLRSLGSLLGAPLNKTKRGIFHNQLLTIVKNTIKLHKSYLFEGVKEAS